MPRQSATLLPQLQAAWTHYQAGRLADARRSCEQILRAEPKSHDALNILGMTLAAQGDRERGMQMIRRALAFFPRYPDALNNLGTLLLDSEQAGEALVCFDKALALRPDFAEACFNRGNALRALDRQEAAIAAYDQALLLRPELAQAHMNRGLALHALWRNEEALASHDRAIALRPSSAEAFYNRGISLQALGRLDEALASYERAITLKPDYAEAFNNRGTVLDRLGRLKDAIESYRRAVELRPDYASAWNNLGVALHGADRDEDAVTAYDAALGIKPDYAEAWVHRGIALHSAGRLNDAVASFDRAIALRPYDANAFRTRGYSLQRLNRIEEAVASFDRAVALRPDFGEAYVARCMAELPVMYEQQGEVDASRAAYERRLRALCNGESGVALTDLAKGVGPAQPFFLAYQGENDRSLQSLYGSLVCRAMAALYPPVPLPRPPARDERISVGIVSGFFSGHSNWKIPIKGWLTELDRRRFRVLGYYTALKEDAATREAASLCERFVRGPKTVEEWRAEITADAPDVLIYPEIGMDDLAAVLSAQRLAPVQCNSWGHPDTSGFPTMDYYLSSDLMEPADAQDHYTERLVRLPNLSVYCEPVERRTGSMTRESMGLRAGATVFWCAQSLFKFLPQYDAVFPRIAREAGDCQFVFLEFNRASHFTELFRRRLDRAFGEMGLRASDHYVFLPRLNLNDFIAANSQCDVFLDSISWSGCNSTLESLANDLPVVTLPGSLMRGRHSMAILKMMGVPETIAETLDDYVAIAARLARDVPWRLALKQRIAQNKHKLYYDKSCIAALEDFLTRAVRGELTVGNA